MYYSATAGVFGRYRRVRRVNEEPLVPIPMAGFVDEGDKSGEPAREAEGIGQLILSFSVS